MSGAQPGGPRPYRDFLTPLMHRRFTKAAAWSLASCYLVSIWQSDLDMFWSWFPLGPTGLRTALLFLSMLMTYSVHIADLRVSEENAPSMAIAGVQYAASWKAVMNVVWYTLSSIVFCEAYIFSQSDDANLHIIDPGRPYERPRLNERPIYIRTLFMLLGIVQAGIHGTRGKGRVLISAKKSDSATGQDADSSPRARLSKEIGPVLVDATYRMIWAVVLFPVVYALALRRTAWAVNLAVAKWVFTLPRSSKLSQHSPFVGDLIVRFFVEGALLLFLWEFASLTFSTYMSLAPEKRGVPLTTESKDSNGSLLQGLKQKREYTRTLAFWELSIIAKSSAPRREAIYQDIDRKGGPMWSQLVAICLGELHAVSKRIQDFRSPPSPGNTVAQQEPIKHLPHIVAPVKSDNVLTNPTASHTVLSDVGTFAKAHGQSPGAVDPITPRAVWLVHTIMDAAVSREMQQSLSQSALGKQIKSSISEFLKTWAGQPFRQTFARRAQAVIFGSGRVARTNSSVIADAATALSKLATSSLTEDRYGRVSHDVANIMRTYTSTIQALESFLRSLDVHWSDVKFETQKQPDQSTGGEIEAGRNVAEITAVLAALKIGLAAMVADFDKFSNELGLKASEMDKARKMSSDDAATNGSA